MTEKQEKALENINVVKSKPKVKLWFNISELSVALAVRNISVMLKSGVTIDAAIKILSEQTTEGKLKLVFTAVLHDIEEGTGLGEAMAKYPKAFSKTITSIIQVGERGGTLEKNLAFLADYLKQNHELQSKLKGAMLYPVIVLGLTVVELLGVVFFILPQMENLFKSFSNIPDYTKFILSASKFIRENILMIIGAICGFGILMKIFIGTRVGQNLKDKMTLKIPVLGKLFRYNILMTFARTLGILMDNGIPISKAITITAETTNNTVYRKIFTEIQDKVKSGQNLADSLTQYPKYFPGIFIKMIEIGEATGTLSENLNYLYEFYEEDVKEMSGNLTALLEPMMIIFVGVMIGGLAIIIIGPIYQLTSSING
jgi:type IV pilus assembly protein PilC